MTAIPLEGTYLILAVVGYLLGISALRRLGLSQTSHSFALAGFLYIVGRASLAAGLLVITWKQALQIDVAAGSWQSLTYRVFLVGVFGLMTVWSALPLVLSVVVDRFGKGGGSQIIKQGQPNV